MAPKKKKKCTNHEWEDVKNPLKKNIQCCKKCKKVKVVLRHRKTEAGSKLVLQ